MAFIIGLLKKWQKKEIKRTFYHYGENPEFPNSNPIKRVFFGIPKICQIALCWNTSSNINHLLYPKATYFGTFLIFDNKKKF